MALNPIPPQAYTKETLQKAYSWLLKQSPELKEMARDQEILVSLYLKAQRSGEESLDRPSVQNFRHELKNLAHMMSDFNPTTGAASTPFYATPTAHTQPQNYPQMQQIQQQANQAPKASRQPTQTHATMPEPMTAAMNPAPASTQASTDFTMTASVADLQFDTLTMERIQAVQKRFNLSSEQEAMRLLISIGFEKITAL